MIGRSGKPPRRKPPVAQMNIIFLTLYTYYVYFCIAFNGGALLPGPQADGLAFFRAIVPTWEAALVYLIWFAFQALLYLIAPGKIVEGLPLPDGTRLKYRINGFSSFIITAAVVALCVWQGWFSLGWIHKNFGALLSAITIFSFVLSLFLYYYGKLPANQPGKVTGRFVIDYFMGTSLNPRVPPVTGFDFKFFCEGRPGMIGWILLDFVFAGVQYERHGFVSNSMILVCALQAFYVLHYFWQESFVLSTIDIRTERFGWMLVYGDLAWVPMTYCLGAFFLIDHVHSLPFWGASVILLFNIAGFYIFRASNLQKDRFKRDPDNVLIWGRKPESLETKRGTRLLISGFWGKARHVNYLGDVMIALSWALPCLLGSSVPYLQPLWFAFLLIMRERRDDRWCAQKYGEDWSRYREKVPWRIIPHVY
ncbi:MAG: hypothetical protein JRJ20_14850 [Deltaproteobacteria bacterium]|nr:hypothetical protein [Deltaproteobacteria bacterium]